jgi:hypothetical protein
MFASIPLRHFFSLVSIFLLLARLFRLPAILLKTTLAMPSPWA